MTIAADSPRDIGHCQFEVLMSIGNAKHTDDEAYKPVTQAGNNSRQKIGANELYSLSILFDGLQQTVTQGSRKLCITHNQIRFSCQQ